MESTLNQYMFTRRLAHRYHYEKGPHPIPPTGQKPAIPRANKPPLMENTVLLPSLVMARLAASWPMVVKTLLTRVMSYGLSQLPLDWSRRMV